MNYIAASKSRGDGRVQGSVEAREVSARLLEDCAALLAFAFLAGIVANLSRYDRMT